MTFGIFALLIAGVGAGWLLWRLARSQGGSANGSGADGARNVTVLKAIVWFGLAAALFAAKLWPLAFMVLVAAGGVSAIEMWRARAVRDDAATNAVSVPPTRKMDVDEAAAVLGVNVDADDEEIRAAHKKLISQIHPDKGGTDYLASKTNEARDVMISELIITKN